MRQEVQATVTLTFDAFAELGGDRLQGEIEALLNSLMFPERRGHPVELVGVDVGTIREEAEIYGLDD